MSDGRFKRVRIQAVAGVVLLHWASYLVVTRITVWRGETALVSTQTALDGLIPHWPWAWPLYWLPYVLVPVVGGAALFRLSDYAFRRAIAAFVGMVLIAAVVQILFPARAPWPADPAASQRAFHESSIILPYATLPSMHVAFTMLACGIVAVAYPARLVRIACAAFPLAVAFATLVLKEHVVLDAVSGALLAGSAWLWWERGVRLATGRPSGLERR